MPGIYSASSGGGAAGGATVARGTNAAKPGTPATDLYWATDTQELFVANGGAWQSIGTVSGGFTAGASGSNVTVAANNFGALLLGNGTVGLKQVAGRFIAFGDDINLTTAGRGLAVKEGANCRQGTAVLVAGAVIVANTVVTANSRIFLTSNADGGTPGFLRVSARVAGTSFTITSSSGTDTSTVAYEIFEPSA